MTSRARTPLAYDDSASMTDMAEDCRAAHARLGLPAPWERAAQRATRPAPSLHFDEQPREQRKRDLEVSRAAAALAAAIYGD